MRIAFARLTHTAQEGFDLVLADGRILQDHQSILEVDEGQHIGVVQGRQEVPREEVRTHD